MNRRAILAQIDRIWPAMFRAFQGAMQRIRAGIDVKELRSAVTAQDYARAMAAIGMDGGMLSPIAEAIIAAHAAGGRAQIEDAVRRTRRFPVGVRVTAGFDVGHPRGAAWAREKGSRLVQEIAEDTRTMVREAMKEALSAGRNPLATAREIREHVGLHSTQARYVRNAREQLEALDAGYFDRARRDRRFDGTVRKAIREGKPLPQATIEKITGRYSERLRAYRAETIARTETAAAQNAGQMEALQQMADDGKIDPDAVEVVWDATGDRATRSSHAAADGQTRRLDGTFNVGGYSMRWPADSGLGAPASETANCRCVVVPRVDYTRGMR